jgi:dTDP-4-dehydrorhamnose reductase
MGPAVRLLVLGASGQVGHALTALHGSNTTRAAGDPLGRTSAASLATATVIGLTRGAADLAHPAAFSEQLRAAIFAHQPTHVINAAAYTAVDRAEQEPQFAQAINAEAVEALGQTCQAAGVPVIHLSTDYVFDGRKPLGEAHLPQDPVNPQGVYGRTKATGEKGFLAATAGHPALVFRTSWVFSAHGANFVKTMLALAVQRDELRVVNDQHGAPTSAEWIAQSLLQVCASWPAPQDAGSPRRGLFHLTASGHTTWHAFAQHLLAKARALAPEQPWRIQSDGQVLAVSTADYERSMQALGRTAPTAPRPANSVLDNSSTLAHFALVSCSEGRPDWASQLRPVLQALLTPTTSPHPSNPTPT